VWPHFHFKIICEWWNFVISQLVNRKSLKLSGISIHSEFKQRRADIPKQKRDNIFNILHKRVRIQITWNQKRNITYNTAQYAGCGAKGLSKAKLQKQFPMIWTLASRRIRRHAARQLKSFCPYAWRIFMQSDVKYNYHLLGHSKFY
jgi:hypothetical protein